MTLEGCLAFPPSAGLDNLRAGVTFHLVLGEGRRNKEAVWGFGRVLPLNTCGVNKDSVAS